MKKNIAVLLLSAAFSAPSFADDESSYIGANIGQSSTDTYSLSTKTGNAYSILAGYQFMKYMGAEIQYNDLGSPTINGGASFRISGFSAVAVGILPFNDQWALLGKLGYANTKLDSPINTTKSDVTYGISGQYSVNHSWGLRLNYDMYTIDNQASQKATTGVLSVGGLYKF